MPWFCRCRRAKRPALQSVVCRPVCLTAGGRFCRTDAAMAEQLPRWRADDVSSGPAGG
jgi:hypothetical protein